MKIEFSDSMRTLQDRFETEKLAQRVVDKAFHDVFSEQDTAFIERSMFFFIATTDASGQPQCSYKGGPRGFVRVTGPASLAFPIYEGNGLYLSAGNVAQTGKVGMLFIDFEKQQRMRVNGIARIDHDALRHVTAAQFAVHVDVLDIHPNCMRNVHKMELVELSKYTPALDSEDVGKAPWGDTFDDVLPRYMKPTPAQEK
jgi:predicted pyridoxine 5'-phosphate oxidase superfamily flavin-nucleotide-binding protein